MTRDEFFRKYTNGLPSRDIEQMDRDLDALGAKKDEVPLGQLPPLKGVKFSPDPSQPETETRGQGMVEEEVELESGENAEAPVGSTNENPQGGGAPGGSGGVTSALANLNI